MDLHQVQDFFNAAVDTERLKQETIDCLKLYFNNQELLNEFAEYLPVNCTGNDLYAEYRDTVLYLNRTFETIPTPPRIRIRYYVKDKIDNKVRLHFDMDFSYRGDHMDEYLFEPD